MDPLTTLISKTNGEVCGCPGFWDVGTTTGHKGQRSTEPYSPHYPTLSLQPISSSTAPDLPSSPPTLPAHISSSPPTITEDSPILDTRSNLSSPSMPSAFSRYNLYRLSPTPPGPPRETCFFYYHGECKRGDKCDRAHETHFTWPVPPPPKYVHRKPCYLPLCPMKDGMEKLLKSNSNSGGGRVSPGTIGIDAADANTMIYVGVNNAEVAFITAAKDEDSGELPTAQLASDNLADISSFIDDKNDIISLSSDSYSSTSTSPSPPPVGPMLTPSPFPHPVDEDPEIASISHAGTHKRLRPSKPQTVSCPITNWPALAEPGETTSVTKRQPEHICETSHKPPEGMSIKEKICFFWYHQGYCRTKKGSTCPCIHTLDTGAREVSLPNGLRFHNPDCDLPLCPAGLRNKNERQSVVQQKLLAQDKKEQHHPEWMRSPPTGTRLNEKTNDVPRSFALQEKICFNWYHQGFCRPKKGTSCPCVHTLDTGVKEVSLPGNLRYHNLNCELSLCPVRLRCESEQEIVFAENEEEELAKDMYLSVMPTAIHPSRVQNMTSLEQSRVDSDRMSLRRLWKQFTDRMNQLTHKYGSWEASPTDCVQPMQQLETAIGLWDLHIQANSDPIATLPIGFQQRAIELGNAVEKQKLQARLKSRSGRNLKSRKSLAHTSVAFKLVAPNAVTDMSIAAPPKGPRAMVVKPPEPPKSVAPTPIFERAVNPNMVPASRKRKALGSKHQLSTRQVKRMRPSLFDAPHGGDDSNMPVDAGFKNPVFFSDFLAKSIVQTKPQLEVKKAQSGVLVDYVLPSGQDRAEWDTDFLRRVFGEIE